MSIKSRTMFSALAFSLSTPVLAFSSEATALNPPRPAQGVEVAQTTARVLTDSEIRRLNHYSAQAMTAILAFGSAKNASEIATIRQKAQRLIDAGARSGMTLINTADYFEAYVAQNANAPVPGPFLDAAGQFDGRTLLSSVGLFTKNHAPKDVDVAAIDARDLAGVSAVAQPLTVDAPTRAPLQLSMVTTKAPAMVAPAGPTIPADAPANVRAILERIEVKGDQWVITVVPGDSLGQYANALYGDSLQFRQIYNANVGTMATPNGIEVGQQLVLPHG